MLKNNLLLLVTFIFPIILYGQSGTKKKSTPPKQYEVDKLYSKYRNQKETVIYFPGGSITGSINIALNEDGKPKELSISGVSKSSNNLSKFLNYFIHQKIDKGFKGNDNALWNSEWDLASIQANLEKEQGEIRNEFTKGNEYTIVTYRTYEMPQAFNESGVYNYGSDRQKTYYYRFTITTGDMRRIAGSKTESFEF